MNKSTNSKNITNKEVLIMFEQMNGNIQLIAEGQQGLIARFDGLETRFDGLETRFDGLETRFDGLETRFDKFTKETNQKFDLLFTFLSRIEDELMTIRKELTELKETKAENKTIIDLEKRLSMAESQISALQQKQSI